MKECERRLEAAKKIYVELVTRPVRQRLLEFDVRTSKWSATRVKAREQHMRAMKHAEAEAVDRFECELARVSGLDRRPS